MKIPKNKYLKSISPIYKNLPVKITNVHLKNLVKIEYVTWIFINRVIYRMVPLNALVFMETAKGNRQEQVYKYQQYKQVDKYQQGLQTYIHQQDILIY